MSSALAVAVPEMALDARVAREAGRDPCQQDSRHNPRDGSAAAEAEPEDLRGCHGPRRPRFRRTIRFLRPAGIFANSVQWIMVRLNAGSALAEMVPAASIRRTVIALLPTFAATCSMVKKSDTCASLLAMSGYDPCVYRERQENRDAHEHRVTQYAETIELFS